MSLSNLFLQAKSSSLRFLANVKRTGWPLFLVGFGLLFLFRSGREIFIQQAGVLIWKLLILGAAVHVAHAVRRQLFPYVDLSGLLDSKSTSGAIAFLGVALIYAAIIVGLCAGL